MHMLIDARRQPVPIDVHIWGALLRASVTLTRLPFASAVNPVIPFGGSSPQGSRFNVS
jgi:hypothetical protein